ncbi:hypothetical protein VTO73DRAFT_15194 [Trametes versicolor]
MGSSHDAWRYARQTDSSCQCHDEGRSSCQSRGDHPILRPLSLIRLSTIAPPNSEASRVLHSIPSNTPRTMSPAASTPASYSSPAPKPKPSSQNVIRSSAGVVAPVFF